MKYWIILIGLILNLTAVFSPSPANAGIVAHPYCRILLPADDGVPRLQGPLLPLSAPQTVEIRRELSPGFLNPILERTRNISLFDDFKWLSDLSYLLTVDPVRRAELEQEAQALRDLPNEKGRLFEIVAELFEYRPELRPAPSHLFEPLRSLPSTSPHFKTFEYIENTWAELTRMTPSASQSSLISVPYPILIPGARFQESYYWDSYFATSALIQTGRTELVRMQVENFLFLIENYGIIPNGLRDYYLSRSQPPVLSQMIRELVEEELRFPDRRQRVLEWLQVRALPLLKSDYFHFWMNSETRWDPATGLNHHFDDLDIPRPERYSKDKEEELGLTYRDVRAEAESGKDFTVTFAGQATRVLPVLLNSLLYQTEMNIAYLSALVGDYPTEVDFALRAAERKLRMSHYLWDPRDRVFRDYHLDRGRLPFLTADAFAPLWTKWASSDQAQGMLSSLAVLERPGGVMASNVSGHQWDGPYGWAPHQYMAVEGLMNYDFDQDALRLVQNWVQMVDRSFSRKGVLLEKMDVVRAMEPIETGERYRTQEGFLWTNGVYTHFVLKHLQQQLQ